MLPDKALLLKAVGAAHTTGVWLQVGSNTMDGKMNDNDPTLNFLQHIPLWNKVFVEPMPDAFMQLKRNVARWPNSKALNAAISEGDAPEATTQMFCLAEAMVEGWEKTIPSWLRSLPDGHPDKKLFKTWANQICSLDTAHVRKHFPYQPQATINVTALSFSRFLSKHAIKDVQVLLIDTESYDYKVLKQVPLGSMRPALIIWEHVHIQKEEQLAALEFVRSHCYAAFDLRDGYTVAIAL